MHDDLVQVLRERADDQGFVGLMSDVLSEMSERLERYDDDDVNRVVDQLIAQGVEIVDDRPKCFTVCWNARDWDIWASRGEGEVMSTLSADDFEQRGVEEGDQIYSVLVRDGRLYLCARMEVAEVADSARLEELTGESAGKWACHCIARTATRMRFDRVVPNAVVEQLRFETRSGEASPRFATPDRLDSHAFRGIRRITNEASILLDELLEEDEVVEVYSGDDDANEDSETQEDDVYELRDRAFEIAKESNDFKEFAHRIRTEWNQKATKTTRAEFEAFVEAHVDMTAGGLIVLLTHSNLARAFYEKVQEEEGAKQRARQLHSKVDSALRARIHAGVEGESALQALKTGFTVEGRRYLSASWLDDNVRPLINPTLTAEQAELLVRLGQKHFDEGETLQALRRIKG